jgi:hypothetical protein
MKIIELLNKIANGEEAPYRIKYNGRIYEYAEEIKWYLRDDMKCELSNSKKCLNDTVEILEEEKKIPEKLDIRQEKNIKNNWKWKVYGKEHSYNISTPQKIIADKLNEVIDYLKSKGE